MEAPEVTVEAPVVTEETAEIDPVERAARAFTEMLPIFKNLASSTPGKKSLVRVLAALVEFPLGKTQPRLLNDHERQLFWLAEEIMASKGVVLADIMRKRSTQTVSEETKEENNGEG